MKDLLEGVAAYEVKLFLDHCTSQKYFTLAMLYERIQTFDYGYSESMNKPSLIDPVSLARYDNLHHKCNLATFGG